MTNYSNVIFSYVSYRRNIKDMPFVNKLTDFEQAIGVCRSMSEIFGEELEFKSLKNIPLSTCLELEEKGDITKELIENKDISAYGISENGEKKVFACEQDHIRIVATQKGFNLEECFKTANLMDDLILEKLEMCFDVNIGYLTANPKQAGTGMEIGCLLFIPAVVKSGAYKKVQSELLKHEFEFLNMDGGTWNEKSPFVIIKNIFTFGYKENQFAEKLYKIVEKIIELEKAEENNLFNLSASTLVDEIFRNYGTLLGAYRISYEEAQERLGSILWGLDLNVLKRKKKFDIFSNLVKIKEKHLLGGKEENIKEIEKKRAKTICNIINDCIVKGEVDV